MCIRDSIMAMHDVIDNIEKELMEKLHCHAVIHMDPIALPDCRKSSLFLSWFCYYME